MKYVLAIVQLAFGLALFLCATVPAYTHDGGLDSYGCLSLGNWWIPKFPTAEDKLRGDDA
jgi:hypothetical protein